MSGELQLALDWLGAVVHRDERTLLALSDPGIVLMGMKGLSAAPAAKGHEPLRKWLSMTRIGVEPIEGYVAGDRVLLSHHMHWVDASGALLREADNYSLFGIGAGRVFTYLIDAGPDPVVRQGFRGAAAIPLAGSFA